MLTPLETPSDVVTQDNPSESQLNPTSHVDLQPSHFASVQNQIPVIYDPMSLDTDWFDPNILSTTNWLDAIDTDFSSLQTGFNFSGLPANDAGQGVSRLSQAFSTSQVVGRNIQRGMPAQQSPVAVSSTFSGHSAVSTESAAEVCAAAQEESASRKGEYYVDGQPARLPKTKRRKLSSRHSAPPISEVLTARYCLRFPIPSGIDLKHRISFSSATYDSFIQMWQKCCVSPVLSWPPYEQSDFPTREMLEHLLGLYFSSFHSTLPFLHPPSFDANEVHWLLLLVMMAVGAHYIGEYRSHVFAISMHEFVRRSLVLVREDEYAVPMSSQTEAQVHLLHTVGLMYSGDPKNYDHGIRKADPLLSYHHELSEQWEKLNTPIAIQHITTELEWKGWIQREEIARTAYCIWLLDCMLAYHFQSRPALTVRDSKYPLPCHEKVWNASSPQDWKVLLKSQTSNPTLQEALQELYVDKRLPRDRGEFARILLIHGLFHRSWEVGKYFGDPLSQWEPTAKKESSAEILPPNPVSLFTISNYTKWQNSACDCLDILHWQANATIGQASGFEHPTVVQLHLARVILLSPINDIVHLSKALTGNGSAQEAANISNYKRMIQRWAVQGQYKARLAAIHAGVTFWHIRRYSVDGFYEAPAIALAALMLWAFGTFSTKQDINKTDPNQSGAPSKRSQREKSASQEESSDDSACDIILLDRPTDDELVQQFVRRGHTMQAYITGVGDLYSPCGPERVLSEACKLLAASNCWGISACWLGQLKSLEEFCKTERSSSGK